MDKSSSAWSWFIESAQSLWSQIATAAWLANVGIPLLVALAAIVIAYRSFLSQLRQDRELVDQERRRNFAHRYAAEARQCAAELDTLSATFTSSDSPTSLREFRTGANEVFQRLSTALAILRETTGDSSTVEIARSIPEIFRVRLDGALGYEDLCIASPERHAVSAFAARSRIANLIAEESAKHLRVLALQLEKWDGNPNHPPEPDGIHAELAPPPDPQGMSITEYGPAIATWRNQHRETMRQHLDNLRAITE
ncbi:hypothetical protein QM806_33855 [Rhodococcus sp. IEGM 1351]|uniref:hypothetical protein n=1 Tax=Rhodococcus sp. IEGM 1351 TaxID=3047089 RepID=UPI0024B66FE1|nr:hypothetical protein [Rhodococcus sp. IEGM 1351]MDI9940361.1 hypothetical protein [Rhodococcus sp. IEGM 1351]